MKTLLALALTLGLMGAMTATASAQVVNVCNGGYCRTIVYGDSGVEWVSDLWREQQ